jgi:HEAT repeat protein
VHRFLLCIAFSFTTVSIFTADGAASETAKTADTRPIGVRAWELLVSNAADEKSERRIEAIAALGTMARDQRAVKLVEGALQDKERDVRLLAIAALGDMGSRRSISKLKQALEDDDPEVVFAAARSLWQMGDKSGRSIIEDVLAGERAAARGTVSSNLERIRKVLTDPKGLVLFGLREGIGAVAGPYAMGMNVVQEFTKDRSVAARVVCANMLAKERSRRSLPFLREALRDENWVVRLTAAKAVASVRDTGSIPVLVANIEDEDEKSAVKLMAAASVLNLQAR